MLMSRGRLGAAFFFACTLLLASLAHAQSTMPWYGAATVGHAASVNGIPGQSASGLRDAGSASGSCALNFNCGITDLPLEPLGTSYLNGTYNPLAIYDNQTSTGNYHYLTFGYTNGVPTINVGAAGSANAVTGLDLCVNGAACNPIGTSSIPGISWSGQVFLEGSVPVTRYLLATSTTLYANSSTGSDSNDCQSATASNGHGPCRTLSHTVGVAQSSFDGGGNVITIEFTGNFNEEVDVFGSAFGTGEYWFKAEGTSTWTAPFQHYALFGKDNGIATVYADTGATLTMECASGAAGIFLGQQNGTIDVGQPNTGTIDIGACTGGSQFAATDKGSNNLLQNINLNGSAAIFAMAQQGGVLNFQGYTVTIGAALAFTDFAVSEYGGLIYNPPVFAGAGVAGTTGCHYLADVLGVMATSGVDPNTTWPGDTNCSGPIAGSSWLSNGLDENTGVYATHGPLMIPVGPSVIDNFVTLNLNAMPTGKSGLALGFGESFDSTTLTGVPWIQGQTGSGAAATMQIQPLASGTCFGCVSGGAGGTLLAANLAQGIIALPTFNADYGQAPGTSVFSFQAEAGTVSGTGKLVLRDGTSVTGTTIIDNVGASTGGVFPAPTVEGYTAASGSLPAVVAGRLYYITDAATTDCGDSSCTTFGTTISVGTGHGGGSLHLLGWYNGTNITLVGK